jgi:hypothetical protein
MSESIAIGQPQPEEFSSEKIRFSYLELFYATLFHPLQAFRDISAEPQANSRLLFFATMSVVLVSTLAPLVHMTNQGGSPSSLIWTMPLSAITGVIIWALMGLLIGLLAHAFTGQSRARTFLTLSGLATLPWIFMGPVAMLKMGLGPVGLILFVVMALLVWLWSVLLFALALSETYQMTPERVMIVLAAPFAMFVVLLSWMCGFIDNIRQLAFHG